MKLIFACVVVFCSSAFATEPIPDPISTPYAAQEDSHCGELLQQIDQKIADINLANLAIAVMEDKIIYWQECIAYAINNDRAFMVPVYDLKIDELRTDIAEVEALRMTTQIELAILMIEYYLCGCGIEPVIIPLP